MSETPHLQLLLSATAAFCLTYLGAHLLIRRFAGFALDRPNERSLHEIAVPRTGGIAILVSAALVTAVATAQFFLLLSLIAVLAVVSLTDDIRSVPVAVRLLAHAVAACVAVWYLFAPMSLWQALPLVIALVWITNLYNFMDGSDGLAAGMTIIGLGTYAVAAFAREDYALAIICACFCSSSTAFLRFNFNPAQIFLGDVGSVPLGFLAGVLGLAGWREDVWPLWFPVVVFGPFIGDATLTLVRRAWRRERLWQAHRDHYYQRLVRLGFGHRGTAFVAYALMAFCAIAALCGVGQRPLVQWSIVGGTVVVLGAVAAWVDVQWSRRR